VTIRQQTARDRFGKHLPRQSKKAMQINEADGRGGTGRYKGLALRFLKSLIFFGKPEVACVINCRYGARFGKHFGATDGRYNRYAAYAQDRP
jgi:hypothetical protein